MSEKYVFTLDEDARKTAQEKLGETDEIREESIKEIQEYLRNEPRLHARDDEKSILLFLRTCKFDIEKTKKKMKHFYEMRSKLPEWFGDRNPQSPQIMQLLKIGVFVPIVPEEPGPLIVIIRTAAHNPSDHKQDDVFKTGKMLLDLALEECESASIYGVYAIFDMKNVSYSHAKQLNPYMIKNAVFAWRNYNCRPQLLEFVNAPVYINVVLNIFRSFMSQKMKDRVHLHYSGFEELHKHISPERLPEEYGGTNGKLQNFIDVWYDKVLAKESWFKESENYKADLVK